MAPTAKAHGHVGDVYAWHGADTDVNGAIILFGEDDAHISFTGAGEEADQTVVTVTAKPALVLHGLADLSPDDPAVQLDGTQSSPPQADHSQGAAVENLLCDF